MANLLGAVLVVGGIGVAVAIARAVDAGKEEGQAGLSTLEGSFSLNRVSPEAIQPGGRAFAFVDFVGSISNSGNAPGRGTVILDVFIAGQLFRSDSTVLLTVNPGATVPVEVSVALSETDPPGDITARAFLVDDVGNTVAQTSSGVLGSIEGAASLSLSGTFAL